MSKRTVIWRGRSLTVYETTFGDVLRAALLVYLIITLTGWFRG